MEKEKKIKQWFQIVKMGSEILTKLYNGREFFSFLGAIFTNPSSLFLEN